MGPATIAGDRPRLREATRARAGPGQTGRAAGGYVSIIRYNRNITGDMLAWLPPVYGWSHVFERLRAAKHFPPCPHFNLNLSMCDKIV